MPTISFDINSTFHERFARRPIGDRYYAGLDATGYATQVVELTPGQQQPIQAAPGGGAYTAILASVDVDTSVVIGFTLNSATVELPISQLALVTLPANATNPYVKNTASSGAPSAPVKLLLAY